MDLRCGLRPALLLAAISPLLGCSDRDDAVGVERVGIAEAIASPDPAAPIPAGSTTRADHLARAEAAFREVDLAAGAVRLHAGGDSGDTAASGAWADLADVAGHARSSLENLRRRESAEDGEWMDAVLLNDAALDEFRTAYRRVALLTLALPPVPAPSARRDAAAAPLPLAAVPSQRASR